MAWRFKASKYKNAAPIVPKSENYVRDICVGSYQTYGNNIAASAKFMAFNWEHVGSSLAVLPLNDSGRKTKLMPLLHAHLDTVTDLDFSPFHDGLLVTGSQDCSVKFWIIPEEGLQESLSTPECTFTQSQKRIETVGFHPTAECLIHCSFSTNIILWDLLSQKELFSNSDEHTEVIQSVSWKKDGVLLSTSCKDKKVRIFDPRNKECCLKTANSHQSIKDSRIVWLGDSNRVLTTGFDAQRVRQIIIRDVRNFNQIEKSIELDSSTGILMPLYDADTGMLFLAGKGDTTIGYMEVSDKEPYLIEGIRHSGEQTKGACLIPKRALNVMQGEVNRILQLTSNSVIPITYQVPRKTYRDFHADLYPDTTGYITELNGDRWFKGENFSIPKISLNPADRDLGDAPITPRLGPKPFTPMKLNGTRSFDEVFYVPDVPSLNQSNGHDAADTKNLRSENNSPEVGTTCEDSSPPEIDELPVSQKEEISENKDEEKITDTASKTPTTAERRKMFELHENGENLDSTDTKSFERGGPQQSSFAERRQIYESKSMSLTECTNTDRITSPVLLRRQGTFKGQKNNEEKIISKEDSKRNVEMTKQQSQTPPTSKKGEVISAPPKRTSTVFGRVSKFRHLKVTPAHKSQQIENVRNVGRQIPGECDGFHANTKFMAVPLDGSGGRLSILNRNKPGKLPDGVIPSLVQGSNIMDFSWDPFDNHRLAVACDDGTIKLWIIPTDGLEESTNKPEKEFNAHGDKIYFIKFHPTAQDVLATGSYDMTIKIWDLSSFSEKIILKGHTDQIFSFSWSPCGKFCATVCKDGKIRVYNPRRSDIPVNEGKGPEGNRGARITWALEGNYIVVTGFDKVSQRLISLYKVDDLGNPLQTIVSDVSPSILIPFYDEDSSTLFLTGKGDSTIYAYEITEEYPHICPLSHHRCPSLHQGLSFLPKNVCNVIDVEFAVAHRLTNQTIESLSFTVPRIKTEFFQDDLFPPTKVTWEPTMNSHEWFSGKDKLPRRISLQPVGMIPLSSQKTNSTSGKAMEKYAVNKSESSPSILSNAPINFMDPELSSQMKAKQNEIQKAISNRMEINLKLEQDDMEGVDEKEWD
ncbi:coronin-7 isoform X2 [Coccinella septempunctata]|uniref:coronin-7 isoform X2 n=1 Tax=Coccinella septempunctata TaxID=41139 RepID=UPI001D099B72|nr:coronin-7 isoform X2 [Coccinella septempunctata]